MIGVTCGAYLSASDESTSSGTFTSKASSLSGTVTSTTPVVFPVLLVSGAVFHRYVVPAGILSAFAIPDSANAVSCVKSFSLTTLIGSFTAFGASFTVAFASSPFVYLGSEGIIRTISSSPALPNALGSATINSSSFSIVFGTPFSSASTLLRVAMTFPSLSIS